MEPEEQNPPSNNRQGGGPGKIRPHHNPKPFTADYQPGQEKAMETRLKKKNIREAFKALLEKKYTFEKDSKIKKQLEKSFGAAFVKNLTVAEIMALQQMQKSIKQADTISFTAVLNQALGMPKQEIEHGGDMPTPNIILNVPPGLDLNLPSNTDGDS